MGNTATQDIPAALVGQFTTEGQDLTAQGGTAGAGSILTGVGYTSATTSSGSTLTAVIAGGLQLAAAGGPLSPNYFAHAAQSLEVMTNNGVAIMSYTAISATGLVTGLAITNGIAAASTISAAPNNTVYFPPLLTIDMFGPGASIMRGVGASAIGSTDWPTLANNAENAIAGLVPQGGGFVPVQYSDQFYDFYQWNVNSGANVTATGTGSPIANANTGAGGAYPSSVALTGAGAVVSDNRPFRRVLIFFFAPANADKVTFATTGQVVSNTLAPASGLGLCVWDSGDLGSGNAGTGISATFAAGGGGGGIVIVGALYIQNAGTNGSINLNISHGGTYTGDWSNTLTGFVAMLQLLVKMGSPARRVVIGDMVGNDMLNLGAPSLAPAMANLKTVIAAIQGASPLSEIVLMGIYKVGTPAQINQVSTAVWAGTWIPAIRQVAITTGCTFLDLFARFGDCSSTSDLYGYTISDNLHFGSPAWPFPSAAGYGPSLSGRNAQQSVAEYFVEKLEYSRSFNAGQNTSYAAYTTVQVPGGGAQQVACTQTQDVELTFLVTAAGTCNFAYGPTNAVAANLINGTTLPIGAFVSKRIPAGWFWKLTGTATFNGGFGVGIMPI